MGKPSEKSYETAIESKSEMKALKQK